MTEKTFTGVQRTRTTKKSVKLADRTARGLITIGGIGTIFFVCLIMVFLVWVVLPLFRGGDLTDAKNIAAPRPADGATVLRLGVDEYRTLLWAYRSVLDTRDLLHGEKPTAVAFPEGTNDVIFGFADGTVRLATIDFATKFREPDQLPPEIRDDLLAGRAVATGGGIATLTPEKQARIQTVKVALEPPTDLGSASPVVGLDYSIRPAGPEFVALSADGKLYIREGRTHPLTRTITFKGGGQAVLDAPTVDGGGVPDFLLLDGLGTNVFLVWKNGLLVRMNVGDLENAREAERFDLTEDPATTITSLSFLNGKNSLLVGESTGTLEVWFPSKPEDAETVDGLEMVNAHTIEGSPAAVTALSPSWRKRNVAIGYADGTVRMVNVTTGSRIADAVTKPGLPVRALVIPPKDDGLIAWTDEGAWSWNLDAPHPDVSFGALFQKVWYEGYPEPAHKWQSTGGTDDNEPKFGLMPLVFGTLKATLYSMLFGLPLALLAAVFASEFLHPKVKSKVKPTIEVMASLPSVVLGFFAALVIAPFLAPRVPVVLTSFLTIPFTVLLGAHLWQLLGNEASIRLKWLRFPLICTTIPVGIALGALLGPLFESWLFAGDIRLWLDGHHGNGIGGWFFLLIPASALGVAYTIARGVGPALRRLSGQWNRRACAWLDLAKFLGGVLATLLISLALAALLETVGLDPRGSVVGTYVQRNALIVGFVMGFAIIPIIFTIADDALSAVPEHLRSASLGAGATPWQTAIRIIIPTAMSGLFSATMIGLGRAVGETMIVLMAAGNTAIMDWNIFNGFRTLSANLATELPEAVVNSTHYRILFLAALVLFLMTFVLNTLAEIIRLRFRKRAFEL